jgi:hypothetical protein
VPAGLTNGGARPQDQRILMPHQIGHQADGQ